MASEAILQAIPHRPPFLFVDEIVEQGEDFLTTRRKVSGDEAYFQGHYPDNPIMPGVLISEAVFQTGAVFLTQMLAEELEADPEMVPVLTKIMDARFKSIVRPGDTLLITAKFKEKLNRFIFMNGSVATEDGRKVMTVTFSVALAKAPQAD